jgi:hypothetical protein
VAVYLPLLWCTLTGETDVFVTKVIVRVSIIFSFYVVTKPAFVDMNSYYHRATGSYFNLLLSFHTGFEQEFYVRFIKCKGLGLLFVKIIYCFS